MATAAASFLISPLETTSFFPVVAVGVFDSSFLDASASVEGGELDVGSAGGLDSSLLETTVSAVAGADVDSAEVFASSCLDAMMSLSHTH